MRKAKKRKVATCLFCGGRCVTANECTCDEAKRYRAELLEPILALIEPMRHLLVKKPRRRPRGH